MDNDNSKLQALQKEKKYKNRVELKNAFRKGETPEEEHFHYLIDSVVNYAEDPVRFYPKGGMILHEGLQKELIDFRGSDIHGERKWFFTGKNNKGAAGFNIGEAVKLKDTSSAIEESRVFIPKTLPGSGPEGPYGSQGKVGINHSNPYYNLDVYGTTGLYSRVGTYSQGTILADGLWHNILPTNDRDERVFYFAYEVMAYTVDAEKTGRHAITHAICVGAYPSRGSWFTRLFGLSSGADGISQTQSSYGGKSSRIELRWNGTEKQPLLQMRVRRKTKNVKVAYHITNLLPHAMTDIDPNSDFLSSTPKD